MISLVNEIEPFSDCPMYNAESFIFVVGFGDAVLDIIISNIDYRILEGSLQLERGGSNSIDDLDELDSLLNHPELPHRDRQIRIPGGSAANVCKCLSQLSRLSTKRITIDVSFVGMIGTDQAGKEYSSMLQKHGVRPLLLENNTPSNTPGSQSTAQCLCFINPEDGQRTMRTFLGASLELRDIPSDLYIVPSQCSPVLGNSITNSSHRSKLHLAHFEGYCMYKIEMTRKTMKEAKTRGGAVISLDLASFEIVSGCWDALYETLKLGLVDIVFCNEDEAAAVARLSRQLKECHDFIDDTNLTINSSVDKAMQFLLQFCDIVVISRGKDGCVAATKQEKACVDAEKDVTVVDTVAAGDYFTAGFLFGWLHGLPLEKCAECGCAAGSTVVQVVGSEVDEERMVQLSRKMHAILKNCSDTS